MILSFSQFERIPISLERQKASVQEQLDEVTQAIMDSSDTRGRSFTVRDLELQKKRLQNRWIS